VSGVRNIATILAAALVAIAVFVAVGMWSTALLADSNSFVVVAAYLVCGLAVLGALIFFFLAGFAAHLLALEGVDALKDLRRRRAASN
jgi:hypothetical protein